MVIGLTGSAASVTAAKLFDGDAFQVIVEVVVHVVVAIYAIDVIVAPELEQTAVAGAATVMVGDGFTLNVTFCVNEAEQFGVALVVVMPVICNVCPLLAAVRF